MNRGIYKNLDNSVGVMSIEEVVASMPVYKGVI
jgi:hypothetical protein